jgi:chemotaxis protein MotB
MTTRGGRSRGHAKGAGGHEEESGERWLLTYADMITLLLVLFIVLFALATINQAKFREFKQSVSHTFLTHVPSGTTKVKTKPVKKSTASNQTAAKRAPNQLKQIEAQLSSALSSSGLLGDVTLSINSSGLVEGLVADSTFFSTNSAQLSAVGEQIVDTSAQVLEKYPNALEVAGYTDNQPITGGPYANNWELSAARATTVVVRMTVTDGLNPEQVVLLGYGQYHPLVLNTSPTAQAENRRVNIVVSPTSNFVP